MLMISRRIGETIVIGDIEITVTEIHRKAVRLAIKADPSHLVLRGEVRDAIEKANRQAAESAMDGLPVPEPGKPKAT
jgi:carbon storage regulator CsrA